MINRFLAGDIAGLVNGLHADVKLVRHARRHRPDVLAVIGYAAGDRSPFAIELFGVRNRDRFAGQVIALVGRLPRDRQLAGFLSAADVDVGDVRVTANMAMPGMVMPGNVRVRSAGAPGRYTATAEFGMAGSWPISLEWNGPAGLGSVNFQGSVQ